jgi:hypothetical protein
MFKSGNFKDKNIIKHCPNGTIPYKKNSYGKYNGFFWGYTNITALQVKCVIFHGSTINLKANLQPFSYRYMYFKFHYFL